MYSQLGQDLWVVSRIAEPGYFVDIGATDGIYNSNSYLLEGRGWSGICVEPDEKIFNSLKANRSCHVENIAIYKESNLELNLILAGEFSTLEEYIGADHHRSLRENRPLQTVKTLTLDDLLAKYEAPKRIDYLSLDTEGSELDILESFSWAYEVSLISVEHNNSKNKDSLAALLESKGYKLAPEKSEWDFWYEKGQ
jgi:FkbM family methyltransferase